jgi:hypothetical protein
VYKKEGLSLEQTELLERLMEEPGNTRIFGGLTEEEINKTIQSANTLQENNQIELLEVGREGTDAVYIKAKIK